MTFAAQGAIAIRNANLMQQLELRTRELAHSVEELQGLHEVGEAVNSSLDLHQVLSTIVTHAVQLSGTEGGSIFEFDEDAQEFYIRAAFGTSEELLAALRATRIGLDDTFVGRAASTRTSIAVADIDEVPRDAHLTQLLRAGWRSMLAVPLVREDSILGALVVRRRRPGAFSPQIAELVETFASQSALAMQHARFFRQLERKSREVEMASRHKSEFLASMSHELRTPLNAVIGFSDVLLDRVFGELTSKQEEYLEDIRDSGQHLLELLNEILDLSKIEAGKMQLELANTSLRETLEHGLAMVRERANRQDLSLDLTLDAGVGRCRRGLAAVHAGDREPAHNAVKFTPAGGTIEASARRVANEIHVSVKDSGIGIAEADQARIFDAFQQGPRTVSAAAEGTGLGLTLCKQIAELHGGRLWVESHVGAWEHVYVRNSCAGDRVGRLRARKHGGRADHDRRGQRARTSSCCATCSASTAIGRLRLAPARRHRCWPAQSARELVLMDIQLPGMDGVAALARTARGSAESAATPVVAVTAFAMKEDHERFLAAGFDGYLEKPVDVRAAALLRRVVPRSRGEPVRPVVTSARILVVDDMPDERPLARGRPGPRGYTVDTRRLRGGGSGAPAASNIPISSCLTS